jgi:2-keto-3-deoxy-6-phosphogluconate aldolase
MITAIRRPPLGERLARGKVIAVLRASDISTLAPVCDVLVEEGILSLELTLTTPGILGALPGLIDRYADTADVGVGTILTESPSICEAHSPTCRPSPPAGSTSTPAVSGWLLGPSR